MKVRILKCDQCGVEFERTWNESGKRKSTKKFCTKSCRSSYVRAKPKNNKKNKNVQKQCIKCKVFFIKGMYSPRNECETCKPNQNDGRTLRTKNCKTIDCKNTFETKRSKRKYCDGCIKEVSKEGCVRGGKASAQTRTLRSKNEIAFADLCEANFANVKTNELFFKSPSGNWDADVILHDQKIAVLWNGIWHYKQVRKNHNLNQVQARDKIKLSVIKANGYIPYVIKDMGGYKIKFVQEEFEKFKLYIETLVQN